MGKREDKKLRRWGGKKVRRWEIVKMRRYEDGNWR
jgi:hypothetical protein